jgi:chemotaxis protein methyltransferase CheR
VKRATLDRFRSIVYGAAGIALSPAKDALVQARVGRRLRALGISTYEDYLDHLETDESGEEIVSLLDAVCTNVTSFFREPAHFEFVASAMQEWLADGQTRFRMWSAACSTGEELYSLGMTVKEASAGHTPDVRILATDLSTTALRSCMGGVYEERRIEGVPEEMLKRYFRRERQGGDSRYRVRDDLRDMAVVRRLNLAKPPFPIKGPLDIVMCRNVMIYFDDPVRRGLLTEIHRLLKPGGYLMVGHAESLTGMVGTLKHVAPGVYTRR